MLMCHFVKANIILLGLKWGSSILRSADLHLKNEYEIDIDPTSLMWLLTLAPVKIWLQKRIEHKQCCYLYCERQIRSSREVQGVPVTCIMHAQSQHSKSNLPKTCLSADLPETIQDVPWWVLLLCMHAIAAARQLQVPQLCQRDKICINIASSHARCTKNNGYVPIKWRHLIA